MHHCLAQCQARGQRRAVEILHAQNRRAARALDIVAATRACKLLPMIGGMVETRLAMGTSACIAAGLGGLAFIDLDTPLFLAADPFTGGYVYEGSALDLRPIIVGHGCTPRT